jgi:hypothetical protein
VSGSIELLKLDADSRGSVIRTLPEIAALQGDDEWNHVKTWSIVMILGAAPARGGDRVAVTRPAKQPRYYCAGIGEMKPAGCPPDA